MSELPAFMALSQEILWLHAVVFLRVGPVMSLFPGFGEQSVSVRIKLALALVFTVIVAPAVGPKINGVFGNGAGFIWLAVSETVIGLIIGIGLRLFLMALQTAGSMAAQATSLSQILGSAGMEPLPAMGHLLVVGGMALAMILDLHVHVAAMVIATYGLFPVGELPEASALSQWGVRQVSGAFALAFRLAAPFVIVSVLYNLTLGIINRAMPQLMVVFVGAPVITAGGLFLLFLLAPMMLGLWMAALEGYVATPFGAG
ncbi:flagellar biosynthetic protein FliR [Roseovarius pelagicus]|uniref:Flagellar biosynthetic protein FliR n=1 Tax=Roseovarius pelagicus TaxID=2980108 RepID=A0ABY6DAS0_9RHOB|nr:flagellar biosynthetic protein FliR [Roseovarius pelagicus]UXX82278.1 flagellar biosynthetic protein FliR [Roseovarius pelagicus]